MPVYEFKCNDCNTIFSELRKMGDTKAPRCPYCRSTNTEKIFSVFASGNVKTSCSTAPGGG